LKVDGVSEEFKQAKAIFQKDRFFNGMDLIHPDIDNQKRILMALINSPDCKEVNDEYQRLKGEKKLAGRGKTLTGFHAERSSLSMMEERDLISLEVSS